MSDKENIPIASFWQIALSSFLPTVKRSRPCEVIKKNLELLSVTNVIADILSKKEALNSPNLPESVWFQMIKVFTIFSTN